MKFCKNPFRQVHLDPGGGVRVCGWTDECVGNLLEEELEDIWHGEKVKKIRESILDGSYRFCRAISCPYLENNSLPDISEEKLQSEIEIGDVPSEYSVACDFTCNHSCPSCRDEVFCGDDTYRSRLKKELNKLLPYLNKASSIVTCGNGDIFSSPLMMEMLEKLNPENSECNIRFETNAALFDEEHWNRIAHLGRYYIAVTATPNSFEEKTFKYLNGGHNTFKKVISNLYFIKKLKQEGIVNEIEISMVMQDRNFWELPCFAQRCIEEFDADKVTVKPLYRWFNLSEDNYWHKDVLNPLHPYHKEYLQMIEDPYLQGNDKIFYWGAKNLHPRRLHPAYRYKEYLELVSELMMMDSLDLRLERYCNINNILSMYIYGDMEISSIIYKLFSRKISIGGFIARDKKRDSICGKEVTLLCDYDSKDKDVILVLNYQFFANIKRDFDFRGFKGRLISLDNMIDVIANGE